MMHRLRGLILGGLASLALTGCGVQSPGSSSPGVACTPVPREENQAIAYAHSLGIPSSLDDVVEVLGCTRGDQDPLEGPIQGYRVYGEQQFREDKPFLAWLAERLDQQDLSLSEARRLIKRFAADPEAEGKQGSYGNITSLEWKVIRENWVLWQEAKQRGMVPSDAVLTVENLSGVFLSPIVNLTRDPLTPLEGEIHFAGVTGYADSSFPVFGQDENGYFYNILGTSLVTILQPTDAALQDAIAHGAEYWYQGFDTRVDVSSNSGIFCADLPGGGVDESKYPPVYNTLLIPGKVFWIFSQEGEYRPGVWEHQISVSFEEVPRSLIPTPDGYTIGFAMPHFTTLGTDASGEAIHGGSIISPASIDGNGNILFGSYLGTYRSEGIAGGISSCFINYDYNWDLSGPHPEDYVAGSRAFRNGGGRYTLPIDPLNPYVHASGIGISFAAPHIFRLTDGTLLIPSYYGYLAGHTPEGVAIIEPVPTRLSVPYPTPNDPFKQ